jgi:hypothetical protein
MSDRRCCKQLVLLAEGESWEDWTPISGSIAMRWEDEAKGSTPDEQQPGDLRADNLSGDG